MDFNKIDTSVKLSENIISKHINIELTLSYQDSMVSKRQYDITYSRL